MYLQLIDQRLVSKYYRSLAAVLFDVDLILNNTEEFFGKESGEYKEFLKIHKEIKDFLIKFGKIPIKEPIKEIIMFYINEKLYDYLQVLYKTQFS